MALYKYSIKSADKTGKAQAHDLDASYKDLTQVCRAIKGLSVSKAYAKLDAAIKGEHAIPYTKFNKGCGHRSELGGRKGRYPKKECKMVYATLKNAAANATHQGPDEASLTVKPAAAYKQSTCRRHRNFWVGSTTLGYGKNAMWADYVTAWMEIFVNGKASEKKAEKPKETAKEKQPKTEGEEKKTESAQTKADEKPKAQKTESQKAEKTPTPKTAEPKTNPKKAEKPSSPKPAETQTANQSTN